MLYANDRIYDWDENKRAINLIRHGLDFNEVAEFDWNASKPRRSDRSGEIRHMAVGYYRGKLHAIVYTERQGITRIISFRRANRQEDKYYESN